MVGSFSIQGNLVDVLNERIFPAEVTIKNGLIHSVTEISGSFNSFIMPGFIDAHVHIESSMLVPSEFAKLAVVHGTVATISDPHEIANVCGIEGVEFMIANGKTVPFKFHFGTPSCVPATIFETAGAVLNADDVKKLLQSDDIFYLSEMMNFPGVLNGDEEVMKKIKAAQEFNKPVDGHAPGLRGEMAKRYIEARQTTIPTAPPPPKGGILANAQSRLNEKSSDPISHLKSETSKIPPLGGGGAISTDHECFTKEEALDKLQYGMKIIIREGSAAKNFEALIDLLHDYPDMIMFCSDDKHPDSLVDGHINQLCVRAAAKGIDLFKILKAACINPVQHYKMKVGLLQQGNAADFIVVKDLEKFETLRTYIDGKLVAEKGKSLITTNQSSVINNFNCNIKKPEDFIYKLPIDHSLFTTDHSPFTIHHSPLTTDNSHLSIPVIEALDGQLITNKLFHSLEIVNGAIMNDVENDILKIVVVNRYNEAPVAKAFIKNFRLKYGAIASSVAHDSHNIVAVGADDESICKAVNLIIEKKGGVSAASPLPPDLSGQALSKGEGLKTPITEMLLPLPVAGLMSNEDGYKVASDYTAIDKMAKEMGSGLSAPFMTLSFMALLVIPHIKLSDKGLFDGDSFQFI
jgi:adenine deaminase